MGRANRHTPSRLGEKLHAIRTRLDLSQTQMVDRLDCPQIPLYAASISQYEQGKREPPLLVLLRYARLAGISADVLIDDDLELPERLSTSRRSKQR